MTWISMRPLSAPCSAIRSWGRCYSTTRSSTTPRPSAGRRRDPTGARGRIGLRPMTGRRPTPGPGPTRPPRCAPGPRSSDAPCGARSRRTSGRPPRNPRDTGTPAAGGRAPRTGIGAPMGGGPPDPRSGPVRRPYRRRRRPTAACPAGRLRRWARGAARLRRWPRTAARLQRRATDGRPCSAGGPRGPQPVCAAVALRPKRSGSAYSAREIGRGRCRLLPVVVHPLPGRHGLERHQMSRRRVPSRAPGRARDGPA